MQFQFNVLTMYIIYGQSSRDILQGINKLDYYLKVSAYQIYKNKDL